MLPYYHKNLFGKEFNIKVNEQIINNLIYIRNIK